MQLDIRDVETRLEGLLEQLSAVEHDRWSHWQRYMHDKATQQPDGSLTIPADLVKRWEEQMNKQYENLSEDEKQSDREQVRKYLPLIFSALASKTPEKL